MRRYFALPALLACLATVLVAVPAAARPVAATATEVLCAPAGPERTIVTSQTDSSMSVVQTNLTDSQLAQQVASPASLLQVTPAGYASDGSPPWTNGADGRVYTYYIEASIYYQTSSPCSGPDNYMAWFNVFCRRRNGTAVSDTPCTFTNNAVSLQVAPPGSAGNTWGNPYGWRKFARANSTACSAFGSQHSVADGSWVRTRVNEDLKFKDPWNTSVTLHDTVRREMGSFWINQFGTTVGSDERTGDMYGPVAEPSSPYMVGIC
jgi:hypothetical protein